MKIKLLANKLLSQPNPIISGLLLLLFASSTYAQSPNIIRDYYLDLQSGPSVLVIKTDLKPNFEIVNYAEKNTFTIKLRDIVLPRSLAKKKLFKDPLFRDAVVTKVNDNNVWIEFHTFSPHFQYTVDKQPLEKGLLILRLSTKQPVKKLNPDDANALKAVTLIREVKQEKLVFVFNRQVRFQSELNTLPRVRLNLLLDDISRQFKLDNQPLYSEFINAITYQQKGKNLAVEISLSSPNMQYQLLPESNPHQLVLKMQKSDKGLPISLNDRDNFFNSRKLSASDDELNKYYFTEAETDYRNNDYEDAYRKFSEIASQNANNEIGVLSLFKAADSLDEIQNINPKYEGNFDVVSAYQAAIEHALKLKILPNEIARSHLQIGKNYQLGKLYEEALDSYNMVIQNYPKTNFALPALFYKADLAFIGGEYSSAVRLFQHFLLKHPKSSFLPQVYYKLATSYHALGEIDLAFNYFVNARKLNPVDFKLSPQVNYAEANTYLRQGQYQKFIESARNLINQNPDSLLSALAAIDLGDYFQAESNIANAENYYKFAIDSTTSGEDVSYIARLKAAKLQSELISSQQLPDLISEYKNIFDTAINPDIKEEALLQMGINYMKFNENRLATDIFELYKQIFPDGKYAKNGALDTLISENIHIQVVNDYLAERYSNVISQYVSFRQSIISNNNRLLLWLIANSYAKLNNYRDSINLLQQLLKISPSGERGEINFEIGENYLASNDIENAKAYYQEVADNQSDSIFVPYSQSRLSEIFFQQEDFDQAISMLQNLIRENYASDDQLIQDLVSQSWYGLGYIQEQLGLYVDSLESYRNVQESYRRALRDPSAPEYISLSFFKLADISRKLLLEDQSLLQYQTLIDFFPDSNLVPWAHFYSADILLEQQKFNDAIRHLDAIINYEDDTSKYLLELAIEKKREVEINRNYANFLKGDSES